MRHKHRRRYLGAVTVATLALGVVLFAQPAMAQDFLGNLFGDAEEKSGLQAEAGVLFYESVFLDVKADSPNEDFMDTDTRVMLHTRVRGESWDITLSGSAHQQFIVGNKFTAVADVEPWEMYAAWRADNWDLAAGNMITRMGRGAFSLLDVANPTDLRHGLSMPEEWIRIPVPQIKFDYYLEKATLHLLYNPFWRESRIASTLSDWSPVEIDQASDVEQLPIFQQSVQQQVFPGIKDYPADDFIHGELGAWLEAGIPGWDFGVYYFTGYDRIPLPQFTEDFKVYVRNSNQSAVDIIKDLEATEILFFNPLYVQKPERNHLVGADLSTTLAGYTWRLESTFQPRYSVYRDDLEFLRPPMWAALLGVDSLASSSFVLSLNFFTQWIMVDPGVQLLQISPFSAGAAGGLVWEPADWPVSFELRGGGLFTDGSVFMQPYMHYAFAEGHKLTLGAEFVGGPADRLGGAYDNNDSWILRYRYQFDTE